LPVKGDFKLQISNCKFQIGVVVASVLVFVGCQKPPPPPVTSVVVATAAEIPSDPDDAAWDAAPEYRAKLIPQDLVEPRQMTATTSQVRVRAIHAGSEIAFRLAWNDETQNDLADQDRFCDACAVQLPQKIGVSLPAPQMGEAAKGVEIAYWNAGWQAIVDGRGDSIKDIYPGATVDHYPFDAQSLEKDPAAKRAMALRYAPARALGNTMAGPRDNPVQDLVAQGPGTLAPASATASKGHGQRVAHGPDTAAGWAVVITRRLPEGLLANPNAQIAFAVWDGEKHEVGSRKMRTGWVPVTSQDKP
jgi:DMSO reductase family type II enzyme heme b subunit